MTNGFAWRLAGARGDLCSLERAPDELTSPNLIFRFGPGTVPAFALRASYPAGYWLCA
jgi:hypothetical protein